MKHEPLDSSMFVSHAYDAGHCILELKFKSNGATYSYHGVTPSEYRAFMDSPSKGKHFSLHINRRYETRKKE